MTNIKELIITQPDDWHLHLRDGDMLNSVLPHSENHFGRAIIMPNLVPPVVTSQDAASYKARIENNLSKGSDFTPLMTLYLTEKTDAADVVNAHGSGLITAVKLYPAGATTNSDSGVKNIENVYGVLEAMSDAGVPLLMHGEVTNSEVDIFDREARFIETVLAPLRQRFPDLKMTMEHVTTKDGVDYVKSQDKNLAASLTTHHLIINRNHLLAGGIRPHYYCLPIAKREVHRLALVEAAISGDGRFFLGTDSAPHLAQDKESACGCAGVFSSINTMSCLAHVFEENNALDNLEGFASLNGPAYYGLPLNKKKIRLIKQDTAIEYPEQIDTPNGVVQVFTPGFAFHWSVEILS
jgi:dihydroorotase